MKNATTTVTKEEWQKLTEGEKAVLRKKGVTVAFSKENYQAINMKALNESCKGAKIVNGKMVLPNAPRPSD